MAVENRILALMGELQAKKNVSVTQADVAQYVGMTPQAFSKWVNNDIRSYSVDVLDKLCEYFDCEVGDILYRRTDRVLSN
jgi:DNA-binding Xre family transcriptional regulator